MSAQPQEHIEQQDKTAYPSVMHRMRTQQMVDDAILYGTPVTALCGETWTPSNDELIGDFPTVDCPMCEHIIDEYRSNR